MVVSGYLSRTVFYWGTGAKTTKLWRVDVEHGVTATLVATLNGYFRIVSGTTDTLLIQGDVQQTGTDSLYLYNLGTKALREVITGMYAYGSPGNAVLKPDLSAVYVTDSGDGLSHIRKLDMPDGANLPVGVSDCPAIVTKPYGSSVRIGQLRYIDGVLYSGHGKVVDGDIQPIADPPPTPPTPPMHGGYSGRSHLYNPETGYAVAIHPRDGDSWVHAFDGSTLVGIEGIEVYSNGLAYAAWMATGAAAAPATGFWIDLTNTTQTTNAVIEFAPLHTVTVEDTAEMRLTLECEGSGGKTSVDVASMQLSLRVSGIDANEGVDLADMGFYLRPHISEGYTVVDNVRARFHLRAEGQSDFLTGLADPDIPDIGVCFFHVYQDKHLDGYYSADMPVLSFDVSTFAVSATPGVTPDFCSMEMHLEIPPALSRPWPPGATFRMHTGALHMHGWAGVPYEMAREKIEFHDASITDQSIDTRSTVSLEAYARGRVRSSVPMKTQVLFDDRLDGVYAELAESNLALDDVLLGDLLTTVYDRLLLTGQASSATEARALVSSALALLAVADITPAETPTDQVTLSTAAREAVLLGGETFDRLVLRDLLPHSLVLAAAVRDTVRMDDESALRAEINQRLTDGLGLVAHLRLDDGHYTAWAMNTDSRATTRYQNYGFNSFMRVGGREYGASDAGLYRLEGDSDDGAPIQSHIRLGMSSLGSRLVKHVPDVYLGYSASGDLLLKAVISDSATGKREANVYRLVARGAASTREGRVKLGRGLNAVYWDFVIENVDGADFALDTIEFMPLAINRRLRGNAGAR